MPVGEVRRIGDQANVAFIPVSWGELVDKIIILQIKSERIADKAALVNITKELELLQTIGRTALNDIRLKELTWELMTINKALWDVEDQLRQREVAQLFDQSFVKLARAVLRNNDARSAAKRRINIILESALVEEKSYGLEAHCAKTTCD